jgi:hypothetical protein
MGRSPSRARVRRVDEWKLGGRVIWLEDPERGIRSYFAHLETQEARSPCSSCPRELRFGSSVPAGRAFGSSFPVG